MCFMFMNFKGVTAIYLILFFFFVLVLLLIFFFFKEYHFVSIFWHNFALQGQMQGHWDAFPVAVDINNYILLFHPQQCSS